MKVYNLVFLFFVIASSACLPKRSPEDSVLREEGVPVGQFRGYFTIKKIIQERIYDTNYLDDRSLLDVSSAELRILGSFSEEPGKSAYENGQPNPISVLLYYTMFQDLSKKLPDQRATDDYDLKAEMQKIRQDFLSEETNLSEINYSELWLQVMSYDAPRSEMDAWYRQNLASMKASDNRQKIFSRALFTIFMNPYFLLKR